MRLKVFLIKKSGNGLLYATDLNPLKRPLDDQGVFFYAISLELTDQKELLNSAEKMVNDSLSKI